MEENKTIIITKAEYERLLIDSSLLSALETYGVDNWEGYDEARSSIEDNY